VLKEVAPALDTLSAIQNKSSTFVNIKTNIETNIL
jgi:hypothetical protein